MHKVSHATLRLPIDALCKMSSTMFWYLSENVQLEDLDFLGNSLFFYVNFECNGEFFVIWF